MGMRRTVLSICLLGTCLLAINRHQTRRKHIHRNLRNKLNELEQRLIEIETEWNNSVPRPVMHTFFEPVEGGCCGMSEQGHENLIKAWEEAWQSFGWDTKVLNVEDAKLHPDFELFQLKMDRANISEYNRRCFWRWLAMAMLDDGGWMSDYDNIPLTLTAEKGRNLMKKPGFKTWGLHVPALIHSDQLGFGHITGLMRAHISSDLPVHHLTDMYVLKYLIETFHEQGMGVTEWTNAVHPGFPYVSTRYGPKIDCRVATRYLTAHLSHYSSKIAYEQSHRYPKIEGMKDGQYTEMRGEAANIMLRDLREHCT